MGGRAKDSEATHEVVVDGHDRACVVKLSAIIRRRKQRHKLSVRLKLIAVFDNLKNKTYHRANNKKTAKRGIGRCGIRDTHASHASSTGQGLDHLS